jgi:hypothetical protein
MAKYELETKGGKVLGVTVVTEDADGNEVREKWLTIAGVQELKGYKKHNQAFGWVAANIRDKGLAFKGITLSDGVGRRFVKESDVLNVSSRSRMFNDSLVD